MKLKKIREVICLRFEHGASVREIVAACKIGRTTVSEYIERATTWEEARCTLSAGRPIYNFGEMQRPGEQCTFRNPLAQYLGPGNQDQMTISTPVLGTHVYYFGLC